MQDRNQTENEMSKYAGNDNYGQLKSKYLEKVAAMDEKALYSECYSIIYQAATCSNNQRADWHWMADACYDEAKKRDESASIYSQAWNRCLADNA